MEPMIHNFSKGSSRYDAEATLQRICAKNLGHFLKERAGKITPGPLLEIGCGTGFVTKELFECFPKRASTITDICPAMLEKNRRKNREKNLNFSLLDGEDFCEKEKYALIISGLAFHWFSDFKKSVRQIYNGLKPGGLLLFSFVETKSFPEWKEVCLDLQLPFTGNSFPSLLDLKEISTSYSHLWEEKITVSYPTALECLRGFKRIGVGTSLEKKQLSPSQMRRLLNSWDERSPSDVHLTYNIVNAAVQKW